MPNSIKICGLSNATTLEAALKLGADWVGFVFFDPSPRHVNLELARDLAAQAKGRAKIVALSVDATDGALEAIIEAARPDWLQLHGRETPERVAHLRNAFNLPVMKAVGIASANDIATARRYALIADQLLLDAKPPAEAARPGGNGAAFDWRLPRQLGASVPWMLSGGLNAENVAQAVRRSGARRVDVSSGVESAPGVKDTTKIRAFIAAARAAFADSYGKRNSA